MLVGGFAVSYYGSPRTTTDIDLWIAISPENAKATLKAIHDFGFSDAPVTESDLMNPKKVFQMGREPLRIDLLTGPEGVDFGECYKNSHVLTVHGVPLHVIGREDLIRNKTATGRAKDVQDVETLTRIAAKKASTKKDRRRPY